jgi:hypothetical protein
MPLRPPKRIEHICCWVLILFIVTAGLVPLWLV